MAYAKVEPTIFEIDNAVAGNLAIDLFSKTSVGKLTSPVPLKMASSEKPTTNEIVAGILSKPRTATNMKK